MKVNHKTQINIFMFIEVIEQLDAIVPRNKFQSMFIYHNCSTEAL